VAIAIAKHHSVGSVGVSSIKIKAQTTDATDCTIVLRARGRSEVHSEGALRRQGSAMETTHLGGIALTTPFCMITLILPIHLVRVSDLEESANVGLWSRMSPRIQKLLLDVLILGMLTCKHGNCVRIAPSSTVNSVHGFRPFLCNGKSSCCACQTSLLGQNGMAAATEVMHSPIVVHVTRCRASWQCTPLLTITCSAPFLRCSPLATFNG